MKVNALSIERLRNLESTKIRGFSRLNIFVGDNGAGKTSILESLHILSSGRSFRSREAKVLVRSGESSLLVFGEIEAGAGLISKAAVEKSVDGTGRLRLDGNNLQSASLLASLLPQVVLSPDMFTFLDGGPVFRRSFIDWGVFHAANGFSELWAGYQKALNQRNKLLKSDTIDEAQLSVWTKQAVTLGDKVNNARKAYFEQFISVYEGLVAEVLDWSVPAVTFYQGWPLADDLESALTASLEQDRVRGFTSVGPQRADLRFRSGRFSADKVLSRGQQKILIVLARIAQAKLLTSVSGIKPIFLVDDMVSELDPANISLLLRLLSESGSQIFMTALDRDVIMSALQGLDFPASDTQVFHVKHGEVFQ